MAWGYVIHAKEIDKKVARVIRDGWEDYVRQTTRIQMEEIRLRTLPGPHPEGVNKLATG